MFLIYTVLSYLMLPGENRKALHDLRIQRMFPRFDLYCTDSAQHMYHNNRSGCGMFY